MMLMNCRLLCHLIILAICLSIVQADRMQQQHGLVGGYARADVNDPFVKAAAKFAIDSLEKNKAQYDFLASVPSETRLVGTVIQVQQQVVAGRNYKLVMSVSDSSGCLGAFRVTIYDHFGDLSVTSFGEEMTCEQANALAKDDASDSDESL